VELYTHYKSINAIIRCMTGLGYVCSSVYLIDSRFLIDTSTFISASLMAMAAQMNLELPHFNALSKMDIVKRDNLVKKRDIERYLDPDVDFLISKLSKDTSPKFRELNDIIAELVAGYSLVQFHPISVQDPDSLDDFLLLIDSATQWGEDREPQIAEDAEVDDYVDVSKS
jgi:GPN-loop GTPase